MKSFRFKISLKKLFIIAVIEIILFALGVRMGIDTFFFFFLVIALLFVLDLMLVLVNMSVSKKIYLTRDCPGKLTEDQTLKVELSFRNGGITPIFNMVIHDNLGCADEKKRSFFLEWISPRNIFKLRYSCVCRLRGRYIIGPIRIELMGLLGFFSGEGVMGLENEIYVYPKTFSIRKTPMLVKGRVPWFGVDTVPRSGDEDEFFGVREYRPGDPIKKIHWFSTAKKNKLIVKEFQKCNFYQVSLLFILNKEEDLGEGKDKISEYMIKIAASLSKYFIEKGTCMELLAHAGQMVYFSSDKGEDHLDDILKFCAVAQAESRISLRVFVQEYYKYIPSDSTIFVIMTDLSLDALLELIALKERNIAIIPLIVISSTFLDYPPPKDETDIRKGRIVQRLSHVNVKPMFFSKGEDLSRNFLPTI